MQPEKFHTCFFIIVSLLVLSCNSGKEPLFTSLSPSSTNIHFKNQLEKRDAFGILYYLYYYNGGGVSTGDVNNDGLPDIYFTANSKGNNKLYINKGNLSFEDITAKAGVSGTSDWCTGTTMADVNSDGRLDIYVSAVSKTHGLQGHNELFINNGNGNFTESAAAYGLDFSGFTTQTAFFDYDHDGDLDCYILNQSHRPNENIIDTSNRRKIDPLAGDRLYRNELNTGIKKFTDVSLQAGIYQSGLGYGLGLAIADINNDGYEDIYVGNDFHENDYYYVNNGNGTFTESGAKVFQHYSRFSMGNDVADYNNDGQLDVITVDMLPPDEKILKTYGSDENPDIYQFKVIRNGFQYQYSKNCLQRNNGNGSSFSETALLSNVSATDWSWSPLFADFDNDGNKDLFISSGIVKRPVDMDYVKFISNLYLQKKMDRSNKYDDMALEKMPDGSSHPFLFRSDGKTGFTEVSNEWGTGNMNGYYNGAAYADLDNDGDLDLVMNCIDAPAVVMQNNAPNKNHLSISFTGHVVNTFGIGAKAYVFSKGKMQYQQLMLTRGFQSSSESRLHFGLDSSEIDSVLIVWPDQKYQVIKSAKVNSQVSIDYKNAAGSFTTASYFPKEPQMLVADNNFNIAWQHRENDFIDFNVQYLIPHAQSTRGPKMAVGDVNGDGLDDVFTCGAKGQPGMLMIQQDNNRFEPADTNVFAEDRACEDVAAVFFDANGDGSADLYVVSGGNEYTGNDTALLDRLYINNGKGNFSKSVNALPQMFANKTCVAVSDIDKDGDADIFVGNFADARSYGVIQSSYLLINDGKAHFTLAGQNIFPDEKFGMVTSAVFSDINEDKWPDLIVAGEWMPITVLINKNGKFEKNILPSSTGWWQTVFLDDVNGDGHVDILAGNWGWNNKFYSGKNGPAKLYVSDFDRNGQTDQLLAYTLHDKEYPFLAKDEMERALPVLRKHYLLYAEYAGQVMKDVFYGFVDNMKPLNAERLGSVVCYGNGKGNFIIKDLPVDLQLAPIFTFQKINTSQDGIHHYISGGNFFDVIPYEGRYDAQALALFGIGRNDSAYAIHQEGLHGLKSQVRDIQWIKTNGGQVLAIAPNNEKIKFYHVNDEKIKIQ